MESKIYVASLSDYNAGRLIGKWIDANQSPDEIMEEIQTMLKSSKELNAEEWAIHDYELGGISIREYESIDRVSKIAEMLNEHGNAFVVWHSIFAHGLDLDDWDNDFSERYMGEHNSMADFVQSIMEETGEIDQIPESFKYYIDWESMARDWELSGDFHFSDGFVFRSN